MAQINSWTWYVSSMYTVQNVSDKPDYVAMVTWRLIGTDGTYTSDVGNNAQFPESSESPDFTPYQNLTEQLVLGWVQAQLGSEGIDFYKAKAQAEVDYLSSPPAVPEYTPLPWATQGE